MRLFILAISLFIMPISAFAEDGVEKHWIDKKLEEDSLKDNSNAGMIQATTKAKELWDNEMNQHYEKLITSLDDEAKKKLQESQRAWVAFRDKEIENLSEFYAKTEGTMYRVSSNYAVMEITRRRAIDLGVRVEDLVARSR